MCLTINTYITDQTCLFDKLIRLHNRKLNAANLCITRVVLIQVLLFSSVKPKLLQQIQVCDHCFTLDTILSYSKHLRKVLTNTLCHGRTDITLSIEVKCNAQLLDV